MGLHVRLLAHNVINNYLLTKALCDPSAVAQENRLIVKHSPEGLPTEEEEEGEGTWGLATRITIAALRQARSDEVKEKGAGEQTLTTLREGSNGFKRASDDV